MSAADAGRGVQATDAPLSPGDLLLMLGVALITPNSAHGVPGSPS